MSPLIAIREIPLRPEMAGFPQNGYLRAWPLFVFAGNTQEDKQEVDDTKDGNPTNNGNNYDRDHRNTHFPTRL